MRDVGSPAEQTSCQSRTGKMADLVQHLSQWGDGLGDVADTFEMMINHILKWNTTQEMNRYNIRLWFQGGVVRGNGHCFEAPEGILLLLVGLQAAPRHIDIHFLEGSVWVGCCCCVPCSKFVIDKGSSVAFDTLWTNMGNGTSPIFQGLMDLWMIHQVKGTIVRRRMKLTVKQWPNPPMAGSWG